MLQTIRDRATGWIAYIIIGLLIIPFALWGINSYFGTSAALDAAEVGDIKISLQEFQRAYQQQRLQLQRMFGENFDPAVLDEARLKHEVLQQLVDQNVLIQAAREEGLRVGDQRLLDALRSFDAFQRDGKFDPDLYERVLRSQGYTREGFEENLRTSLMMNQLAEGVRTSSAITKAELDRFISLREQKRDISYVVLPLAKYRETVTVDETEIEAYFQKNQERFHSPEQVKLQYVELKVNQLAEDVPVSDEDLRTAYQEQIVKYTQPEERSASHILVEVTEDDAEQARARAQKIHDEIASGAKTFAQAMEEAQVSGSEGIEAGDLGVIPQGFYKDPAFESALYSLKNVGDISEPVQTSFGFHIIRLDGITPEKVKSFEEVRDQVANELRTQRAEARFYDAAETLSNLSYEHPDSLEPAAQALGLQIQESDWFSRSGGKEGIAAYPKVISAAFSDEVLVDGLNSEPIEVDPSHVIVIRLQARKEAEPRKLEEVHNEITNLLKTQKAREAAQQDAEALKNRAELGESLKALAGEYGGELKEIGLATRTDGKVARPVLDEAFRLRGSGQNKPSLGMISLNNGDQAVIAVTQVVPGKAEDLPETERKTLAQNLTEGRGTAELDALLGSLRQETKVVTFENRL